MRKVRPPLLKPGNKIGVVSPARYVLPSEIEGALEWLEHIGLVPVLGKHVYDQDNQFAGTDENRASDIIDFLENDEIKCIWATRGGYGSVRMMSILSDIDPSIKPKWFVGYSDVSVIHSWLNETCHLQSVHGPMLFSWNESAETQESFKALYRLLTSGEIEYQFERHLYNSSNEMRGELCGGNMSMLYSMRGTQMDIDVSGKILFLEDIDEYLYHIDRMMQNFKFSGWLDKVRGMLIGGMTDMNDNEISFGQGAEEIIASLCKDYDIPVFFGHPAGHIKRNIPLLLGEEIHIHTQGDKIICKQ